MLRLPLLMLALALTGCSEDQASETVGTCDCSADEYCMSISSDVAGEPGTRGCTLLPEVCLEDVTCLCLEENDPNVGSICSCNDSFGSPSVGCSGG